MSTSISRKAALIGAIIVMAVVATLTLQPSRANAATGTILAGSTITVGTITTTLQANSAFNDAVSPWSAVGFFNSANGGTDVEILSNNIAYVAGTSFTISNFILIELLTIIGNCTILIDPNNRSVVLSLAAGATYTGTVVNFPYVLDGCGPLLTAAVNNALLGPGTASNPVSINFNIM